VDSSLCCQGDTLGACASGRLRLRIVVGYPERPHITGARFLGAIVQDDSESGDGQLELEVYTELLEPVLEGFALRQPRVSHMVHYCDRAALEGIVNSKEFWFNPISLMSDISEIVAGKELIVAAAEHGQPAAKAMFAMQQWVEDFWERAKADFEARLAHDREHTFIACWSECDLGRNTHDDLSMWRGYGDDGDGYALVVKSDALLSINRPRSIVVLPVEYQSEAEFKARAANYIKTFAINFLHLSDLEREQCADVAVRAFSDLCFYLAVSHKHVGFAVEKEWRLIWQRDPGNETEVDSLVATRLGFERLCWPLTGFGEHNQYLRLDSIKQVMVGPCNTAAERERAVRTLFRGAGCAPDVAHSRIPYRRK